MSRPRHPRRAPTRWSDLPLTMSVPTAAAALGVSRPTLAREIAEGRLRAVRLGRRVLVTQDDLRAMLAGEYQGPRAQDGTLLRVAAGGVEDVA